MKRNRYHEQLMPYMGSKWRKHRQRPDLQLFLQVCFSVAQDKHSFLQLMGCLMAYLLGRECCQASAAGVTMLDIMQRAHFLQQ